MSENALAVQEGGDHYKNLKIQPVEFIHANGLGFMEGCVIKYVARYKRKNGLEDLKKARHFLDLLIQLEYPEGEKKQESIVDVIDRLNKQYEQYERAQANK